MKKTFFAVLALIALVSSGAVRAEITTVILSDDRAQSFTVAAEDNSTQMATLTFSIGPGFTSGAKVIKCTLRVVPTPQPNPPRADQDVTILSNANQVGQWSAYSQTTEPYAAELKPEACAPGTVSVFTLKTESKLTKWEYHGGGATPAANQPRLIVTYDSPSPVSSGLSTDWKYAEPSSFFSSPLWQAPSGEELLANPVSYGGAVYLASSSRRLYRVAGAGNVTDWPLAFNIDEASFAFVTAWGRLQVITTNAIHSCDLTTLRSADKWNCYATKESEKKTVNLRETPAMGPDGSLYFKNVNADGRIVARNPALKEIWRTELKLTAVSPIALSANGQYAYVLADIPVQEGNKARMIALLRIDTTTGETVAHEISYCPSGLDSCNEDQKVKPQLLDLLRPSVASKVINDRNVDYVFVTGNTSGTGVLQLIAFEPRATPRVVWNKLGKVATVPVLSVDGNSLFAVRDGNLKRYFWFNTAKDKMGAYSDSAMKEDTLTKAPVGVTSLVIDGSDRFYFCPKGYTHCEFTPDGALVGYTATVLYDISPKASAVLSPAVLAGGTIYSAETVPVPANPGVKNDEQVILKGNKITFPNNFRWPVGATLKVQSVRQ